ncbi:replication-relaxation family protein [Romboutsia timonensis]|uniref:replication-relaxation family protein n=1 Tax=Romboutsia timonensis TaxID=1776391 RepID=UPI002A831149|nr:replication-relaxation family protein [Romboutsia timonensis]MDY3960092.1 replication-relaxation family protein [Romboutsia timonensis]
MAKKNKVVFDSLVTRDKKIIELIEKVGVITREQVQRVLFKKVHQNIPMRRLSHLTENKLIKRSYYQIEEHKNVYVYYLGKKPSKRNIRHEITVTEFITNVMAITDVLEVNTHYEIGNIIADGYIKYKDSEGKIRRLLLEVQLSNKVNDCVEKYKDIKNLILDNRPDWQTIPRLIVITDLPHQEDQLKNVKVKYDTKDMKNLRKLLFD